MSNISNQVRNSGLSREEEADQDLRHTSLSPRLSAVIAAMFLCLIFAVPLLQAIVETRRNTGVPEGAGNTEAIRRVPGIANVIDIVPPSSAFTDLLRIRGPRSVVKYGSAVFPDPVKIRAFETSLEKDSVLSEAVLSPSQYFLTRFIKTGNHKVYVGQDGWLFFQFDVSQATSPKFSTDLTVNTVSDVVRQFREQDVEVIVMPMVSKASLYPDKMAFSSGVQYPVSNPRYHQVLSQLRQNGVLVFDTTAVAAGIRRANPDSPWFLATDTHWRPELAAAGAGELAAFIKKNVPLGPSNTLYRVRPLQGKWPQGDLVRMLDLTGSPLYSEETVVYHEVTDARGRPWQTDPNADVMMFGDSFTEVFEKQHAGLAENLSAALGRPVDRVGKPGPGMQRFKDNVFQELCQQPTQFRAKRLIIWEFAVRDMAFADWDQADLSLPKRIRKTQGQ